MRANTSAFEPTFRMENKQEKTKPDLIAAGIRLDFYSRKVERGDREVMLGNAQFHLLAAFVDVPGVVFTREERAEALSVKPSSDDLRTIDTPVMRLRKKICQENEIDSIGSVRGSSCFLKQSY
jgi:two-component system, OmpR family, phosphate regulon response regulator PhoB